MFNNRKPDASPFPPLPTSTFDVETQAGPNAQPAARKFATHASIGEGNCSIINEWLTMKGDLESEGDILVKGRIHGNVLCKLLIIDVDAYVEGGITAEEVIIRGRTKGVVQAMRVRLEKTAIVDSEIFHDAFSAEEGARIRGALRFREEPQRNGVPANPPPLNVVSARPVLAN